MEAVALLAVLEPLLVVQVEVWPRVVRSLHPHFWPIAVGPRLWLGIRPLGVVPNEIAASPNLEKK